MQVYFRNLLEITVSFTVLTALHLDSKRFETKKTIILSKELGNINIVQGKTLVKLLNVIE